MMMYLLLRDNKQSGPYSLEELKTLGLKAYDLVWVDGKSAAWRYPSELEELISFAPAVEEQPFDRFYKKASTARPLGQEAVYAAPLTSVAAMPEKAAAVSAIPGGSGRTVAAIVARPNAENENYTGEPSAVPGKRIIYVTMPAGKGITTPVRRMAEPRTVALVENRTPENKPLDSMAYKGSEAKMSQVQEDQKNDVEIIPPVRKQNASRIGQLIGVAVCILALLAAGVFIGLSINKETFGLGKKIASNSLTGNGQGTNRVSQPLPVAANTSAIPVVQAPVPSIDSIQTQALLAENEAMTNGTINGGVKQPPPPRQANPREKAAAGSNSRNQAASPVTSRDSASTGIPVVHREAVHRTDLPADKNDNVDKDVVKSNITNLVSVGTNGYTVGTFGGITDLQLTVSNRSVYPLDLVVVEIQYIQANKKVFKTENLYFRGIAPGAALMQEAPKSTRGIKVQYKITLVNSKELGLSYSGI